MEKKFYEMPELKVVDLDGENILAGSETEGEESGNNGGQGNDSEGDAKRMFDWD